uniref:Uncharacterized protein n=1 Tax=viral metagenome TaxID=1070528 RepID=A0A6C0EAD5_9ZZZZ
MSSEFTSVTCNLAKAHKILKNMKSEMKGGVKVKPNRYAYDTSSQTVGNTTVVLTHVSNLSATVEEFKERATVLLEKERAKFNLANDLKASKNLLKNFIYRKNGEIGLDKVLSKIEEYTQLKNTYITLRNASASYVDLDTASRYFKNYLDLKSTDTTGLNRTAPTSTLCIFTQEELDTEIKRCTQELNRLENQRDTLNATNSITFNLPNNVHELLGTL